MNYKFNEAKMFMDVTDGIAVIINIENGIYYGMNTFSTKVLEALTAGMASDVIAAKLMAIKGAPADIEASYGKFVEQLLGYELLIPGTAGADVEFDAAIAAADNFVLEVAAFTDAQEMLLADPIHEVKEESGWTPEKASIGYSKEETQKREKKVQ